MMAMYFNDIVNRNQHVCFLHIMVPRGALKYITVLTRIMFKSLSKCSIIKRLYYFDHQ